MYCRQGEAARPSNRGQLRDTIGDTQGVGTFKKKIKPTLVAKVLFGALDETATNWILNKRRYNIVSDSDSVVDLLVNDLKM